MKILLPIFIFLIFLKPQLSAQCNQFYHFKDGQIFTYTSFDKKDKLVQKEVQKVIAYAPTANGFNLTMETTTYDKKDKEILHSTLDGACADGIYTFDVSNFLNDELMQAFNGMELEVEGEPLKVPNTLTVGQDLPSGDCTVKASSGGTPIMTLTMQLDNRRVTGKESVTTEAGTFDCFVIEQDIEAKMLFKQQYTTREYLAKDVGPVRIESYNKKGDLVSRRDLTSLE